MGRGMLAFTVVGVLLGRSVAPAATFSTATAKDGKVIVTLVGEIADGDSEALKTIIRTVNNDGRIVAIMRLNSPGGSVSEGVKLADMIRFGKMVTSVVGASKCASACFIIFAAGTEKYVNYTASVGVHGASDQSGEESAQSSAATVTVARIVKALGVPPSIIGKMVVTPPDQMVWLTPDDLRSMGTTMTGKPAQVPTKLPLTSQLPSQLRQENPIASQNSTASHSVPPRVPTLTWNNLLDRAIELSSQQHGGNPELFRICQPELKECINGLSFVAPDGTDMVLKAIEDMSGKLARREVCSFNMHGDIRSCVDWDTGATHRDMKDKSGDWYRIDNR
jgi:hypothetical protein